MSAQNNTRAYRIFLQILFASVLMFAVAPKIHADEWDKQTKFTFSEPVQVPGTVLPAGTYMFRLMHSETERHVVQIWDESGRHLITSVLAIPNRQLEPKGRTVIKFTETAAGQPEAVKAWFYPGDAFGQEFVYKKGEVMQATAATATTETAVAQPAPAPVEEPKQPAMTEPVPAPAPEPTPAPATTDTAPAATVDQTPAPAETPAPQPEALPKTGSDLPMIALLGVVMLASAMMLRSYRRQA